MAAASKPFSFEAHPAERGRRKQSVTLCAGCCSCCCCCLHSIGGLVAAAVGSAADCRPASLEQRRNPFFKKTPSATGLYWLLLLLAGPAIAVWCLADKGQEGLVTAFGYLVFGLPLVQLGVSVVAGFLILLDHRYEDKTAAFGALGRITACSIIGALAGLALMFFTCIGFAFIGR